MIKLTAQECFDRACAVYEQAKSIIGDLTVAAKEISPDFNGEIAMRQFDLIAQAIMLNIAVQDGKFDELEKTFIENITEYSDILIVMNKEMQKEDPEWPEFKWTDIDSLKPENKEKLGYICADAVKKFADEFTFFFSAIDLVDEERDYYEELQTCLFHLITFISAVNEGGFDPEKGATEENIRGLGIMKVLFNDAWEKNLEKFKEQLGN